jgi:hypothetical protein
LTRSDRKTDNWLKRCINANPMPDTPTQESLP